MANLVQPLASLPRHDRTAVVPGFGDLGALPRETLGDRVYDGLRGLLIAGRLAPGDKLSLRKVAVAVGVSMMPVRAAVNRLAADGALEVLPGRAVRVPILKLSQFHELTQIRLVVEGFAAEEAARRVTSEDLVAIARYEAEFRAIAGAEPLNAAAAVTANHDLHYAVYRAARMPTLIEMIERLWLKAGPILNLDLRTDPKRVKGGGAITAHAGLLRALMAGDPQNAREALQADIRSAARHIEIAGYLLGDDLPTEGISD
jgi:DNA-binding GntR family transcriptional regulator